MAHWSLRGVASALVFCVFLGDAGCSQGRNGFRADSTAQVHFYSPEGATVMLHGAPAEEAAVTTRGPRGDRLEHASGGVPAKFDLQPGVYPFAYTNAAGAEDATIYGELEIREPQTEMAMRYFQHSFIPIKLAGGEHQEAEHLHPSRDLSYTVGEQDKEFDHLQQGDLITKVYFVADLEGAKKDYDVNYFQAINDLDRRLAVLADREEYLTVRYDDARRRALLRDPSVNIEDKIAHENFDVWGVEEEFVRLSEKRQATARERESVLLARKDLEAERGRRNALLRSMKIVHRSGALVLATPDLSRPFHENVAQAAELGEVVAVVRVGGRHYGWGSDRVSSATTTDSRDLAMNSP